MAALCVLPQVVHAQVPVSTVANEERTWQNDPAVENARDLFFIGRDLWSATTNQPVRTDVYGGTASGGGPGWLVAGRPDLVLFTNRDRPDNGFVQHAPQIRSQEGDRWILPGIETCDQHARCQEQQIRGRTAFPGPFMNQDLRRVLYFRDGDLWRAEVDWSTRDFVNHKQVTQIGILNPVRSGDIMPIAWHDNTLILRTRFSQEKPILRVDLTNGAIDEMGTMMVFENNLFANPSASRLCASHRELLACYEMRTGETYRISLPHEVHQIRLPEPTYYARPHTSALWVNDEILLIGGRGRDGNEVVQHVIRVDFRNRSADELITLPGSGITFESIPDGQFVVAWVLSADRREKAGVRIAVADGAGTPLPGDAIPEGIWFDRDTYVYSKERGGISEIGTWLYDVASGEASRICHQPAALLRPLPHPALFFPEIDVIYLNARLQDTTWASAVLRADLSAGECERMQNADGYLAALMVPPIDLRFGVTGDALWQSTQVSAPQQHPPATVDRQETVPDEARGLEAVLQAIEGQPAEIQDEVHDVYRGAESDVLVSNYYDTACIATAYLDWRHDHANERLATTRLFLRQNFHEQWAHCADPEKITQNTVVRVRQMLGDGRFTEDQVEHISTCTGEMMAERFVANPVLGTRPISSMFVEVSSACRRQYTTN